MSNNFLLFQKKYFELLEDYIGGHFKFMEENNLTFYEFINKVDGEFPITLSEMKRTLDPFNEELNKLWHNNQVTITKEIQKLGGLKTFNFFIPDSEFKNFTLSDTPAVEFIKRIGLYSDTIFLDDPMWRVTSKIQEYEYRYRFLKFYYYGLNLLSLKKIIFSDTPQPICLIVPSDFIDTESRARFEDTMSIQRLEISSSIFGKKFSSEDEIWDFLRENIKRKEDLIKIIKNRDTKHEYFIHSIPKLVDMKTMGEDYIRHHAGLTFSMPSGDVTADVFLRTLNGYLSFSNQVYYKSFLYDAYPIFTEREIWEESNKFLISDYKNSYNYLGSKVKKHHVGVNVLTQEDFKWLGNISIDKLIKIRKRGELIEFRNLLSKSLNEYHIADIDNIDNVKKDVKYQLEQEFSKHRIHLNEIKKRYKYTYKDFTGILVSGTFTIVGAYNLPLGVIGAILGGRSVKDIYGKYLHKKSEISALKRKPINILFDAHNRSSS